MGLGAGSGVARIATNNWGLRSKVILSVTFFCVYALAFSQAKPTLRFWAVTGSILDVQMYRDLAKDFEKEYSVHVEVTPLGWGNFNTKYFASLAAGIPPDVGVTNLGGPFDYASVGGLVDYETEFGEEGKKLIAEFDPKMLEIFRLNRKTYAVPNDVSTLVLCYRKDIFKRLGLRPPETWSDLNRLISTLEGNGYQFYFGFTNQSQWAISLYTMPFGLKGLSLDEKGQAKVEWQNPQYQAGILEALRLWYMHDSPGKDLGPRALGMFGENEPGKTVALIAEQPAVASQLHITKPELDGKWGMAPWPRADDGKPTNIMGGTSYVIFRKSKLREAAFAWVKYLNTVESQHAIILDHLHRGEDSSFLISPLKKIWAPENSRFWLRPQLLGSADQREVIAKILPTLQTTESIHGAVEANRLEANLLDTLGAYIQDQLGQLAQKRNLSKAQLIQSWGKRQNLEARDALEEDTKRAIADGYEKITPVAVAGINSENRRYQEKFGDVIARLPEFERRQNALTVAKGIAVFVSVLSVAMVAIRPPLRKHWVSYAFVAIPLGLALFFVFVPALVALYLSFTEYHPVLPLATAKWQGLKNFGDVIHSGDLVASLGRTILYAVATLPIGIGLALVFAYVLNSSGKGSKFWRFLYFSPLVTSVVSIALIFSQLFLGGKQGWLNAGLLNAGFIRDPIPFLTSERTFLACIVVLAIWHGLAFTILVFLAGFQQVPKELFEAAAVDGANNFRRFANVAVPGIRPQVFFVSVLGLIGAFQVFETVFMLANKSGDAGARFGPNDSGLTVVPLLYHYGFETFEMGKAAALAYVLFVIILAITWVQFRVYRSKEAPA